MAIPTQQPGQAPTPRPPRPTPPLLLPLLAAAGVLAAASLVAALLQPKGRGGRRGRGPPSKRAGKPALRAEEPHTPRGLPEGEYFRPKGSREGSPAARGGSEPSSPQRSGLPTIHSAVTLAEGSGDAWEAAVAAGEEWTKKEPWASLYKAAAEEEIEKEAARLEAEALAGGKR